MHRIPFWTLLLVSWLIPATVFGVACAAVWRVEFDEAKTEIASMLRITEEHVASILAADTLVLEWMQDRTANLSWDEIEKSRSLYDLMAVVDREYPQFSAIFMVDSDGRMRINDHEFPLSRPIWVNDRDYFQGLASGSQSLFVGEAVPARRSGKRVFHVARPRRTADGVFDGLIAVSVPITTVQEFLQSAAGNTGNAAAIIRSDGKILLRYPESTEGLGEDGRAFINFLPQNRQLVQILRSPVDGERRMFGVKRIGDYPVIVVYGVDYTLIVHRWLTDVVYLGSVAFVSALALSFVSLLVILGYRREHLLVVAGHAEQIRRREAEAETIRMSKYEAVATLAGGIAHYFNNALPGFVSQLEIAIQEIADNISPKLRLHRLLEEIKSARKIIGDLSVFSDQGNVSLQSVDLSMVADDCLAKLRQSIHREITLETDIQAKVQVVGDPFLLSQLITNLLRNAQDALQYRGGTIGLSLALVKGGPEEDDTCYARILCSDDGPGMSVEVMHRAFDPFFTTKGRGNLGLGLSICAGIVRAHSGRISVDSTTQEGTRFAVWLPARARPSADA